MGVLPRRLLGICLSFFLSGCAQNKTLELSTSSTYDPKIVFVANQGDETNGWFEVTGLDVITLETAGKQTDEQQLLRIFVQSGKEVAKQPLLGELKVEDGRLRFRPRFPLVPGLGYRAEYHTSRPADNHHVGTIVHEIRLAKAAPTPPAVVRQIYPSRDLLPENLLKFYLHFSASMTRGEAYKHIKLLDAMGRLLEGVFLELDEELWDPAGQRLTLLLDPGRIKRGLKPREELGSGLIEGKHYSLVVESDWPDANGQHLAKTHRKSFTVGKPTVVQIDPLNWKLSAPVSGSREPLVLNFPEPLDSALLERLLTVVNTAVRPVVGSIKLSDQETCWKFTPATAWQAGSYQLVVDGALEDLAGNRIDRLFETDLQKPRIPELSVKKSVQRPFDIR